MATEKWSGAAIGGVAVSWSGLGRRHGAAYDCGHGCHFGQRCAALHGKHFMS
jgi:hypothetical protein